MWLPGLLLSAVFWTTVTVSRARTPVILMPGLGGSQLWALQTAPVRPRCNMSSKQPTLLWLAIVEAVFLKDCLVEAMTLTYNKTSGKTHDAPGLELFAPDFGNTSAVETLNPSVPKWLPDIKKLRSLTPYKAMVTWLVGFNYSRGVDVLGAPYDFRRGPNELGGLYGSLQRLVERSYSSHGPVVLVAHSMGGLHAHRFLSHVTQAWKDKHIRALVTLSSPWGGSVKAVQSIVSGIPYPTLKGKQMRPALRSFPATAWLLPSDKLWNDSEALVLTSQRNYTRGMLGQLLMDVGANDSLHFWRELSNSSAFLDPPGVEVHCLYGSDVDTPAQLLYTKARPDWPDFDPTLIPGKGDGTVNLRSLQSCLPWAKKQKQGFFSAAFPGVEHIDMASSSEVFDYIQQNVLRL